jgi:hypothetical protein
MRAARCRDQEIGEAGRVEYRFFGLGPRHIFETWIYRPSAVTQACPFAQCLLYFPVEYSA